MLISAEINSRRSKEDSRQCTHSITNITTPLSTINSHTQFYHFNVTITEYTDAEGTLTSGIFSIVTLEVSQTTINAEGPIISHILHLTLQHD